MICTIILEDGTVTNVEYDKLPAFIMAYKNITSILVGISTDTFDIKTAITTKIANAINLKPTNTSSVLRDVTIAFRCKLVSCSYEEISNYISNLYDMLYIFGYCLNMIGVGGDAIDSETSTTVTKMNAKLQEKVITCKMDQITLNSNHKSGFALDTKNIARVLINYFFLILFLLKIIINIY
jgi:hypothetical protein